MPRKDGFAVAEWFQDDPDMRRAMIMLLTSDRPGDMARCREAGLAHYLVKPIKKAELLDALLKVHYGAPEPVEPLPAPPNAVAPASPEQDAPCNGAPLYGAPCKGAPLRVLLADDNAVGQIVGRKLLQELGCQVQVASNGCEVLQQVEQSEFDVILMDVEMPQMDGLEATRRIREKEALRAGRHVPILAVTAYASGVNRQRCLDAGMDAYLSKPFTPDKLSEAIQPFTPTASPTLATPSPLAVAASPQAFDSKRALQALGGNAEFLAQVVSVFMEQDYPRHMTDLRESVARGDAEQVRQSAHGLKGALGSLGAEAAAALAKQLQDRAGQGDLSQAANWLQQLESQVDQFVRLASEYQPEGAGAVQAERVGKR